MKQPHYSFRLEWSEDDKEYVATVPEWPGLSALAKTPAEAIAEAQIALSGFLSLCKTQGMEPPQPLLQSTYSGQFRLRLPKLLHRQAAERAERDGVSLNTWTVAAIAEKIGSEK